MVCLFFVISGYVLNYSSIQKISKGAYACVDRHFSILGVSSLASTFHSNLRLNVHFNASSIGWSLDKHKCCVSTRIWHLLWKISIVGTGTATLTLLRGIEHFLTCNLIQQRPRAKRSIMRTVRRLVGRIRPHRQPNLLAISRRFLRNTVRHPTIGNPKQFRGPMVSYLVLLCLAQTRHEARVTLMISLDGTRSGCRSGISFALSFSPVCS